MIGKIDSKIQEYGIDISNARLKEGMQRRKTRVPDPMSVICKSSAV